jgi:hypothetical protein
MKQVIIAKGDKYGKLTVIKELARGTDARKRRWIYCACECGNRWSGRLDNVRSGNTISCGCAEENAKTKHGGARTPEYRIWAAMLARCNNPNDRGYKNYGGRGIRVCKRWHNFSMFIKDVGLRPTPQHELDRVRNDRGYMPSNCQWATCKENNRNKRTSRIWTVYGQVFDTMQDAADVFGVHQSTIGHWCHNRRNGCRTRLKNK